MPSVAILRRHLDVDLLVLVANDFGFYYERNTQNLLARILAKCSTPHTHIRRR
jgi:hypothetical protein